MSIKQIIPTSGNWYVMHRQEDSPETCQAVRIAAWAHVKDDDVDEVLPLITDCTGCAPNKLVIPDAEDVVAICDEEGSRDPNWNDIAKHGAEIARAAEERAEATEPRANAGLDRIAVKFPDLTMQSVHKLLASIQLRAPYLHVPDEMQLLIEIDFIEPLVGCYRLMPLGEIALKLLNQRHR